MERNWINRLDDLIDMGKKILSTGEKSEYKLEWINSSEQILWKIYTTYFNEAYFEQKWKQMRFDQEVIAGYYEDTSAELLALLKSTRENLEKNVLGNIEFEIKRTIFQNFLDYSFDFLDRGDDVLDRCACVLARIVLEDTLKTLAVKNSIDSDQSANQINQNLRSNGVYALATMQQITQSYSVGNKASHSDPEWDAISHNLREKMVRDVEELVKNLL